MEQSRSAAEVERSVFEGILDTLSNKHSQFDINLQGMSVRLPNIGMILDLNGHVTVTCHFRDMTDDEKKASAARNVALMSKA
jgi:hypothetical protein